MGMRADGANGGAAEDWAGQDDAQAAQKPKASEQEKPTVTPDLLMKGYSQQDEQWAGTDDQSTKDKDERTRYTWTDSPQHTWNMLFGSDEDKEKSKHLTEQKFANVGCTLTALSNGLSLTSPKNKATPKDVHERTGSFNTAFDETRFTDLSGQGKKVEARPFTDPKMERMDPVPIGSDKGREIIEKAKQSVEQGQPVLLGYTDNVGATGRHSILAVGTGKDGQLQVIDSWDGQKKSLDDALKTYPVKNPSFDYAYSMRNKSEPELNLNR
jgi:hypothetical protein